MAVTIAKRKARQYAEAVADAKAENAELHKYYSGVSVAQTIPVDQLGICRRYSCVI